MIKIEPVLQKYNILDYPLEKSDHLWIINSFKKTQLSALLSPQIKKIFEYYMPTSFVLKRKKNGRPYAESASSSYPVVSFSISHRANKAVLLVSKSEPCGVDLEVIKDSPQLKKISERYFGAKTQLTLMEFYKAWTAREAFIKTMDLKLFAALSQIDFNEPLITLRGAAPQYIIDFALYDKNFILAICRGLGNKQPLMFFKG